MKNVQLLNDTMNWIKAHPELHRQSDWVQPYDANGEACGTSMCFAGHAAMLAGATFDPEIFNKLEEWNVDAESGKHVDSTEYYNEEMDEYDLPDGTVHVSDFARDALGLNSDERAFLFAGHRSVQELEDAVDLLSNGYTYEYSATAFDWIWKKEEN
jgi:hypothetical protein